MKARLTIRPVVLFCVSFLFLETIAFANDEPQKKALPSVQEVMDRYVAALGGRAAIFKHKAMTVHEKFEAQGQNIDRVVYYKEGKKTHEKINLPNNGEYQSGYDGTTAWEMASTGGAALIEGDEALSKIRDADMYYPARIMEYFRSMEVVDVAEFGGHTCYHLKGTNNWGRPNEHFYDTKSGLLIGYRFNSAWRGGAGDESLVINEYKDFDGWQIPVRISHTDPNRTITEVVNTVTFDDVSDAEFSLPDSVKALVAKKQ